MSKRRNRIVAALAVATIGFAPLIGGTAFAATATKVGDEQIVDNKCEAASPTGFCKFQRDTGTAKVVTAGATDPKPQAGTGYLRLDTPAGNDKGQVFAQKFNGMKLADISDLAYQTYVEQVGANDARQAPALNIPILPNKKDANGTALPFTTLVWEPVYTTTAVVPKTWQSWSPSSTPTGSGGWWASRSVTNTGTPNAYGFTTYTASFADVKAALPDAVVAGGVGPNQGGGNPGLRADVDQLKVNDSTFDFDNAVVPTGIAATGGDKQTAEVGKPFAQPLSATVTGANSAPVPDKDVVFTVTKGDASFGASKTATQKTGPNGVATSPALTAGKTPGPVEVTATSGTLTTTFTETVAAREADLSVTATVPPTAKAGTTFTASFVVRNAGPIAATQVATGVNVPAGLKITAAPGGAISRDGASVGYLAPSIAANGNVTYTVTVAVDRSVRGAQMLRAGTYSVSTVRDPNLLNNAATPRVTIVP